MKSSFLSTAFEAQKTVITPKESVSLRLISIDTLKKTANIEIDTKGILKDCWLYSMQTGIRFSTNFQTLLPGKHQMTVSFSEVPKESDFELIWR